MTACTIQSVNQTMLSILCMVHVSMRVGVVKRRAAILWRSGYELSRIIRIVSFWMSISFFYSQRYLEIYSQHVTCTFFRWAQEWSGGYLLPNMLFSSHQCFHKGYGQKLNHVVLIAMPSLYLCLRSRSSNGEECHFLAANGSIQSPSTIFNFWSFNLMHSLRIYHLLCRCLSS